MQLAMLYMHSLFCTLLQSYMGRKKVWNLGQIWITSTSLEIICMIKMSQNKAFISIEQFIAELQNREMFWDQSFTGSRQCSACYNFHIWKEQTMSIFFKLHAFFFSKYSELKLAHSHLESCCLCVLWMLLKKILLAGMQELLLLTLVTQLWNHLFIYLF